MTRSIEMLTGLSPHDAAIVERFVISGDADSAQLVSLLKAAIDECQLLRQEMRSSTEQNARLTAELAGKKKKSRAPMGRPFYGSKRGEPAGARLIVQLRAKGKSLREIAQALGEKGIKSATGSQWTAQSVRNVLKREEKRLASRPDLPGFD